MNSNPISRAEIWGLCFAFFSFLFTVHMASTIYIPWFHTYIGVAIVIAQLVCLITFLRYMGKK